MTNTYSLNIEDIYICEDTYNFDVITEYSSQVEVFANEFFRSE